LPAAGRRRGDERHPGGVRALDPSRVRTIPTGGPPRHPAPGRRGASATVRTECVMTVDVVIAGGGPTGLMLASELRLCGATVVVLERLPAPTGLSKALGLAGRSVQTLNYRGLLERFGTGFVPAAAYARFAHLGGIPLDVGRLVDSAPPGYFPPPVPARQARVEEVLEERARELGTEIRRGHEVVDLSRHEDGLALHGPG